MRETAKPSFNNLFVSYKIERYIVTKKIFYNTHLCFSVLVCYCILTLNILLEYSNIAVKQVLF